VLQLNGMSIRAFIAAEIGEEVREKLARLQSHLKYMSQEARWVPPKDMHFTLTFLGEVPDSTVGAVSSAMDKAAGPVAPFACEVAGLGFFGSPRSPRVIWAGMRGNVQPLLDIHSCLAASMKELGFEPDERPFAPHLTLARLKFPKHTEKLIAELERKKDESLGNVQISRIVLIKSNLGSHDDRYAVIYEARLSGL
jgi:RNA 2',3'-cyclic 3'-phosphodiesterase